MIVVKDRADEGAAASGAASGEGATGHNEGRPVQSLVVESDVPDAGMYERWRRDMLPCGSVRVAARAVAESVAVCAVGNVETAKSLMSQKNYRRMS